MATRDSERAIFRKIAAELRDDILAGRPPAGAPMPPEKELAYRFDAGLGTIGKAMKVLMEEGLIVPVLGRVARVREMPKVRIVSIPRGSRIKHPPATAEDAADLGVPVGQLIAAVTTGAKVTKYVLGTVEFDVK